MPKKWIVGVLAMTAFCAASAGEEAPQPPREPVQLTDVELDQVTAGGVLAVIIITPGKGSHEMIDHDRSIIIFGAGPGATPSHTIIKTP